MRLLDRYLFRELITPLMFCLGGFSIFWISFDLFNELNELQDRKLHLLDVVEYAVALMPQVLVTLLPVILLLALLHALTQHARHNEITAMRAAGLSLWRICTPHFIVGALMGLVLFATSEFLVPRSTDWANHILSRHVQKPGDVTTQNVYYNQGFKNPRTNRFWFIGEYHLDASEIMIRPQVSWNLPDGSRRYLSASRAVFTNHIWTFYGAIEYNQTNSTAPITPFFRTNELAEPEFEETPRLFRNDFKITSYKSLGVNTEDLPLSDIISYLKLHPHPGADSSWLLTQLNERLAAPFTCLVVVLIAIPFGTASGRRNLFVGVAGSIFICFGFIVAQKFGIALGTSGRVPAWLAAWLPNLIFAATGLALTLRTR